MGRAARRQQQRAARRAERQQGASGPPRSPVSVPAAEGAAGGGSFFKPRWLMDIISELRKVTWPSRQETAHLTTVVIIVSLLFGLILGTADLGFGWLIERTLLR